MNDEVFFNGGRGVGILPINSYLGSQEKQYNTQIVAPYFEEVNLECSLRIIECHIIVFEGCFCLNKGRK